MSRTRRHFTPEQKAEIVRRNLAGKEAVSDLADRFGVQPSQIHGWVKQVLDQAQSGVSATARPTPAGAGQGSKDRPTGRETRPEERGDRRADGGKRPGKKSQWGTLTVPTTTACGGGARRDAIVDYVAHWTERTELPAKRLLGWMGLGTSKFHQWRGRYGKANEHNGKIPRDWWLEDWEKQAIVEFHDRHPLEGYRRLAFMMLDDDVVAVSPTSVYRVLKAAGRLDRRRWAPSKKGSGFEQPERPHQHWHVDISYLNLAGTFYFLISVLDGYSRYVVHWEIRQTMTERDTETVVQRALEKYPGERPRIISDHRFAAVPAARSSTLAISNTSSA